MPSQSDDTRDRFPEQKEIIREIESAIEDIRNITNKQVADLTAIEDRLKRIEGVLEYLSRIQKGP